MTVHTRDNFVPIPEELDQAIEESLKSKRRCVWTAGSQLRYHEPLPKRTPNVVQVSVANDPEEAPRKSGFFRFFKRANR